MLRDAMGGASKVPQRRTRWRGARGRQIGASAAVGMLLFMSACDTSGIQRNFGLPAGERIESAEATAQYQIVQPSRAFVNAPHALLVLQRDLHSAIEQQVALPNPTSLAGENKLMLRAQTSGSASANRLTLSEVLQRFGGVPTPFGNVSEGDLMVTQDRYGSFVYTSRRVSDGLVCVLAFRRVDTGARPLPRGSTALDMMLRNCVHGSVEQALAPISEAAFGLGTAHTPSYR